MSPATKRNFRARAPVMCSRFSSSAPRCCGDSTFTTSFVFGSRIVSGRTTATISLDAPVVRGLGEDLLAQEAGGAR